MKYRPAAFGAPTPSPSVLMDVTEQEVYRILATPTGKKVMAETISKVQEKIKEDALEEVRKKWNDRLNQAEDYVGILGMISDIKAIEMELEARKDPEYEAEYQKRKPDGTFETVKYKPAGWRKTHLSMEEIVNALVNRQSDAVDMMGGVGCKLKPHYEAFLEDYNEPIVTDSYNLNVELDLEQYNFVEDDAPFRYMTDWQIYEEGLRIGDNSCRFMATIVDAMVLMEHPTMRKLVDWFMRKRNEKLRAITSMDQIDDMIDRLRRRNISIPGEWKRDLQLMMQYQELTHGVYTGEEDAV